MKGVQAYYVGWSQGYAKAAVLSEKLGACLQVNIMSSGQWPESSEDSQTSYATAHSQQHPTLASPQHHRQQSGDSLLGYTELDTPPRETRCDAC